MKYNVNDKFIIEGGHRLNGLVHVQTSKNAILPIMASSILSSGVVQLHNCPDLLDVHNMIRILRRMGAKVHWHNMTLIIDPSTISNIEIDCELSKTMRSSIFLLGAILAKFRTASISSPGGCDIGKRPIDIHVSSMRRLGVNVEEMGDYLLFDASKAKARTLELKLPSVGATENLVIFASTLKGKTVIKNCALEPEVVDLCDFLSYMGAKILGVGTSTLTIYGVERLHGTEYTAIGDRIVAGTLMCAVAGCGGELTLKNIKARHIQNLIDKLRLMGCQIEVKSDIIKISSLGCLNSLTDITTGYYPDFPTDMQSIMLTLSCISSGKSSIIESVFENRFLIVPDLIKMGADISKISNREVEVLGKDSLYGSKISARDLRGGAGLVLAGLMANGETMISNVHFIDRGYEHFENMLTKLGAVIERI